MMDEPKDNKRNTGPAPSGTGWVHEVPFDSAEWALKPGEAFDDPPRVATVEAALAHEGELKRQGRTLLTPTKRTKKKAE